MLWNTVLGTLAVASGAMYAMWSALKKDPDEERLKELEEEYWRVQSSARHWERMTSAYAFLLSDPAFAKLSAEEKTVAHYGQVAKTYKAESAAIEAEIKLVTARVEEKRKAAEEARKAAEEKWKADEVARVAKRAEEVASKMEAEGKPAVDTDDPKSWSTVRLERMIAELTKILNLRRAARGEALMGETNATDVAEPGKDTDPPNAERGG